MKWLILCLPLFGCGQSCEEQGGKLVKNGEYYVYQWIDMQKGRGYMQSYPNYICVKEEGK